MFLFPSLLAMGLTGSILFHVCKCTLNKSVEIVMECKTSQMVLELMISFSICQTFALY